MILEKTIYLLRCSRYNDLMKKWLLQRVMDYLAFCARTVLRRAPKDVVIVGITGSTGKTSAKEALGLVAKHIWRDRTVVSPGNLNNEIGLPLAILDYQDLPTLWQYPILLISALLRAFFLRPAQCYVLEYAIDSPGDMDHLVSIARPNWVLLTNITSVHLENFTSQKELIDEKLKIIQSMVSGGNIIYCGDDEKLSRHIKKSKKYLTYTFGKNSSNNAKISAVKMDRAATEFAFRMNNVSKEFKINALGVHYIYAVVPAIIFGLKNKLSPETLQRVVGDFSVLPGRGNIVAGINNSLIINDTYNANPLSTAAALELLKQLPAENKIAVLGDMLELGKDSEQAHHEILKAASRVADIVLRDI